MYLLSLFDSSFDSISISPKLNTHIGDEGSLFLRMGIMTVGESICTDTVRWYFVKEYVKISNDCCWMLDTETWVDLEIEEVIYLPKKSPMR